MRSRRFSALLPAAIGLFFMAPPWAAEVPGDRPASLILEVRGADGALLEGAAVEIQSAAEKTGPVKRLKTGGTPLSVGEIAPGRYRLLISAEGYADRELPSVILQPTIESTLRVDLVTAFPLEGMVVDPAGKPVAGAAVCVVRDPRVGALAEESNDGPLEQGRACAKTDAGGKVVFQGMPRGSYRLSVEKLGLVPLLRSLDLSRRLPGQAWHLAAGGTLTGRVVDPEDKAVARAKVVVTDRLRDREGAFETTTDAGGLFKLSGLAAGRFRVEVQVEGMLGPTLDAVGLEENAIADVGVLRVRPGRLLQGTISGPDGEPVKDVEIRVHLRTRSHRVLRRVTTDSRGRFRAGGFNESSVDLVLRPPKAFAPRAVEDVALPRTDLRIDLEEAGRIAGRVRTTSGGLPPRMSVSAFSWFHRIESVEPAHAETDEIDPSTGRFEIEGVVPAEEVTVEARAPGYSSEPVKVAVEAGREAGPVELTLEKGLSVEGEVVDRTGAPVSGAVAMIATGPSAMTDSGGTFRMEGIRTGMQTLQVSHPEFAPLERKALLPLPEGEKLVFELVRGGTVAGSVTDTEGSPVEGIAVTVPEPHRITLTDATGRYRIDHLPPGSRSVIRSGSDAGDYEQRVIEIADGETIAVDFQIGGTLEGRVTRAGAPVVGASLTFALPGDWNSPGRERLINATFSDPEGYYRFSGVHVGRACMTIVDGSQTVTRIVEIPPGREARVDLALPDRPLQGRVVADRDDRPIGGAQVSADLPSGAPQAGGGSFVHTGSTVDDLGQATTFVLRSREAASTVTGPDGGFLLFTEGQGRQTIQAWYAGYLPSAAEVDLPAAAPATIRLARSARVAILLRDPQGRAVPGDVTVCLYQERSSSCNSGGSARIEQEVREGRYTVVAGAAGFGTRVLDDREVVADPEGRPQEIVVTLAPGAALVVRMPGTEGTGARLVSLKDAAGAERARLVGEGVYRDGEYRWRTQQLEPGDWQIVVDAGDGELLRKSVTVVPGPDIEVMLP